MHQTEHLFALTKVSNVVKFRFKQVKLVSLEAEATVPNKILKHALKRWLTISNKGFPWQDPNFSQGLLPACSPMQDVRW